MATKAEQRRNTITEFLEANPSAHTAEAIADACGFAAADTDRALGQLAKNGVTVEADPDEHGTARWALAQTEPAASEPAASETDEATPDDGGSGQAESHDGTGKADTDSGQDEPAETDNETVPEPETTAPGDDTEANGGDGGADSGTATEEDQEKVEAEQHEDATAEVGEHEGEEGEPAAENAESGDATGESDTVNDGEVEPESVPDPDPAVLLLAAQLAAAEGPVGLEAITKTAFKVAGPKQCETALYALCALAEHGALTCSDPFAPDDRDREDKVEWTLTVDAAELDRVAAIAQLADAPPATTCPTCQTEIGLPHPKGTGRKRTDANARGDGRRRLADGELQEMLITLVKENPGEELKPSDFVRELKDDPRFSGRISANPSGAVRSALLALCKSENGEWVDLLDRTPQTFRCRETQ